SIQAFTVTLLGKDTPARGTACTWPCAITGMVAASASAAARMEARIVMSYSRETATRRTIASRSDGATTKASAEMGDDGPRHSLRLVEIGEVARVSDRLHPRRAVDAGGEFLCVTRRQHLVRCAPHDQGRRFDQ